MTVQVKQAVVRRSWRPSNAKIAGGVVWLGGVVTTAMFLSSFVRLDGLLLLAVAAGVQATLTAIELSFWRGDRNGITVGVMVFDSAINAAGLWPMVRNIDQSNLWWFLVDVTGLAPTMSPAIAGILALIVGFVLAAAPELIWKLERRNGTPATS
jgi:hypothetical protein